MKKYSRFLIWLPLLCLIPPSLSGCVPKSDYEALQVDYQLLQSENASLEILVEQNTEDIKEKDKYRKGKLLEQAISNLFQDSSFKVSTTNLNNEDEELDIVLHNNCERPFFLNLNSPIILVECKNWSKAVNSGQVRDFEGKLRNHLSLCRLGIFIASLGYTEPTNDILKRLSRGNQVLTSISIENVYDYLNHSDTLEDWLQTIIGKPF